MRTANKQNQNNPINERKINKSNNKNFSKSPMRSRQNNNANNQYAVIEQAKRDFQKFERTNYYSNKNLNNEKNYSKENYNSKNSKNSDCEISKDTERDSENRPFAIKNINSYVKPIYEYVENSKTASKGN